MNFESVSVENPRLAPSQEKSPGGPKRRTNFGNDRREVIETGVSDGLLKQIMIEIALEKIAAHSLCGGEYVRQYLMDPVDVASGHLSAPPWSGGAQITPISLSSSRL